MTSHPPTYRCSKCDTWKPFEDFPPSKAKRKGQWCRQCFREQARRKLGLKASERTVECVNCGVAFGTTYAKAMFCSRECKSKARWAEHAEARDAAKPDRRCVWCGTDLPKTMRVDAKFCSERCNNRAHQSVRRYRRRLPEGERKRATIELPSFIDIAERDNWRCGICGKRVDPHLYWPDPKAGSIDHLLPVSKGGGHEMSNLQLSHFVCNWSKRDQAANDRLRLL